MLVDDAEDNGLEGMVRVNNRLYSIKMKDVTPTYDTSHQPRGRETAMTSLDRDPEPVGSSRRTDALSGMPHVTNGMRGMAGYRHQINEVLQSYSRKCARLLAGTSPAASDAGSQDREWDEYQREKYLAEISPPADDAILAETTTHTDDAAYDNRKTKIRKQRD